MENRQKLMARDFATNESLKTQEYFVYFKFENCTVGAKDPTVAADDFISGCLKEETGEDNVQRTHQTPGSYYGVRRGADT